MKIILLLLLTFGALFCIIMSLLRLLQKQYFLAIQWQAALFFLTIPVSVIVGDSYLTRTVFFPVILVIMVNAVLLNNDIASAGKNPKPKIGKSQEPKV